MAGQSAAMVAARLIAEGRAPSTPALAVENAGRREARLIRCDLATLGQAVGDAAFDGPVLLLVGAVAARAREIGAPELTSPSMPASACR